MQYYIESIFIIKLYICIIKNYIYIYMYMYIHNMYIYLSYFYIEYIFYVLK